MDFNCKNICGDNCHKNGCIYKCSKEECQKTRTFGIAKISHCFEHKSPMMWKLNSMQYSKVLNNFGKYGKCHEKKCNKRALYNIEENEFLQACRMHKKDGMKYRFEPFCYYRSVEGVVCKKTAIYIFKSDYPTRCEEHKPDILKRKLSEIDE